MSKQNNKKIAAIFGITFVWFTTQFGGGFASGAQIKSYFIDYGIHCLYTCVGAQAICAIYNAYISYFSRKNHTYDYRSFNDKFYGKLAPVFSNIYELIYILVLLVVPAVAFSTGGTTLATLTGIPYIICTAVTGIFIFIVSIYGTAIVRKVATALSIMIVAGLLLVFIPNIIVQWDEIAANASMLAVNPKPTWPAIWSMLIYAGSQITLSPAIQSQHAEALPNEKDAIITFFVGFLVNSFMILLSVVGLLAVISQAEYQTTSLPVLLLVKSGVGGTIMMPVISVLIILGSVSTAVNLVAAGTVRVCKRLDANYDSYAKPTKQVIITTIVLCFMGFGVAQFGLLSLVTKGYGMLAYLSFPTIMIPYIIHFFVTRGATVNNNQ